MRQAGQRRKRPFSLESLESRCFLSGDGIGPLVQVRLEATDLDGQPIQEIAAGQEFLLRAFADDLREGERFSGVFGVYADVWYRPELIGIDPDLSDSSVEFADPFVVGRHVDASLPGLLNDIGSFSNQMSPTGEQELSLWTVKVRAVAPGLAHFVLDEGDQTGKDVLLYGVDQRLSASQVEFVGTSVQITAADGSVPEQNDFPVTVPDETPVTPPTPITPPPPVIETPETPPSVDIPGTVPPAIGEQLTPDDTNPTSDNAPLVKIRLQAVDWTGQEITSIREGEDFLLRAYVDDLRTGQSTPGVFAAYVDVWYRSELIDIPTGSVRAFTDFNSPFADGRLGESSPGLLNDIGAFAGQQTPTGADELPVWSIRVRAKAPGVARFVLDGADKIGRDVLLYGVNEAIPLSKIQLVGDELQITGSDGSIPADNDLPVIIDESQQADSPPEVTVWDPSQPTSGEAVDPVTTIPPADSVSTPQHGTDLVIEGIGGYYSNDMAYDASVIVVSGGGDDAQTSIEDSSLGALRAAATSSAEHDSAGELVVVADENDDGNLRPVSQVAVAENVGLQQLSRAVARAAAVDVLMEYASTGVPRRVDRQTAEDDEQSALD